MLSITICLFQDPESIDALQSASYSQTGRFKDLSTLGGEFSSKLKDKFVRKSEANFHSFLYPDQVDGETGNLEKNRTRSVLFITCIYI